MFTKIYDNYYANTDEIYSIALELDYESKSDLYTIVILYTNNIKKHIELNDHYTDSAREFRKLAKKLNLFKINIDFYLNKEQIISIDIKKIEDKKEHYQCIFNNKYFTSIFESKQQLEDYLFHNFRLDPNN